MEIIKCTAADAEKIRDLSIKTYRQTFDEINTKENMNAYLEEAYTLPKLINELNCKGTDFFAAVIDEKYTGYVKINEVPFQSDINNDESSLELERLYVLCDYHGKGVGRALMEYVIDIAKKRGKSYIWLGVWEPNERAKSFYKKYGYYRIGSHDFVMGDDVQTDYILRKDL